MIGSQSHKKNIVNAHVVITKHDYHKMVSSAGEKKNYGSD